MTTTVGHLMISEKQEEDEQCSNLLQTVWSEYNIKGKERLHAHIRMKRETPTLEMKIFHCFSWYSVISSSRFYEHNKYCFKIEKKLDDNNIRDLEQTMKATEMKMQQNKISNEQNNSLALVFRTFFICWSCPWSNNKESNLAWSAYGNTDRKLFQFWYGTQCHSHSFFNQCLPLLSLF